MSSGVISVKEPLRQKETIVTRDFAVSFMIAFNMLFFKSTFLAFLICPVLQDNLYFL